MSVTETRVKVAIISSWKGSSRVNWRDALGVIQHDRLILKYLRMGEVVGEDNFPFSALSDLAVNIPDNYKLNPEKEHFGLKFYVPGRGDLTLILTIGDNLLIYDEKKFKEFVHTIFETLINGKAVRIQLARIKGGAINMESKWQDGSLRIVSVKSAKKGRTERNIVVLDPDMRPIPIFSDVEDMDVEEVDMDGKKVQAWKIKHFYINETVTSYLYIPEKKTRLFILRYLLKYIPGYFEFIMKVSKEFPTLQAEFKEVMEKELKELESLDETEKQILMALYSGLNPLEIHQFLGLSEREIEEIYDRMIDKGLLKIVMIRKVVDLTREGRKIVNKLIEYGLVSM
ncbi:CheF family chemotaxis protein [Thermococcus sp.]|uniref:CheF family chemotaxis protein n=1 Tax=Thermococcus sp. TaxID=35749 RepID=UPI0025CC1EF8|nr:CheF family chemotaxis protein [Thermococcus sp.]